MVAVEGVGGRGVNYDTNQTKILQLFLYVKVLQL